MKITEQHVGEMVTLSEFTGLLGYFGNSSRNYLTDRLVARAATAMNLTLPELYLWGNAKNGRWSLDAECDTAKKFADYMSSIARLKETFVDGDWDSLVADIIAYCGKYSCKSQAEFPMLSKTLKLRSL